MKKLITIIAIFVLVSCSKDEITNHHYYVDTVEVQFSAQRLITNSQEFASGPTEKMASTQAAASNFDSSYDHPLPATFIAYFVANETKGQYTEGEIVLELQVNEGTNTITVPQMDLHVYVTNYSAATLPSDWYTWDDAIEQLPQTSEEIYLLGDNVINYSQMTEGSVELLNPYASVMIFNNQWVSGVPNSYDTGQKYSLVTSSWYNLYLRNSKTNTSIPIDIPGNPNSHYTLDRDIDANLIYQFELNGSVLDGSGNLNVIVKPMEQGYHEEINL